MAEDKQKLADAYQELEGVVNGAKQRFNTLLKSSRDQLAYAKEQYARWDAERKTLAAFKDDLSKPENNTYVSVDLLCMSYEALRKMMELEIEAWEANLATTNRGDTTGYKVPQESVSYLEQQCRFDLAISRYLVRYNITGIDTVLRATQNGQAVTPQSDAQKAERQAAADALAKAASLSKVVQPMLDQFGQDLAAVRALNKWGMGAFGEWDKMDANARKTLLEHVGWQRMQALRPFLQQLHERSANAPPLQKVFVAWKQEKLPFRIIGPVVEAPAAAPKKAGTDVLDVGGAKSAGKGSSLKLS